MTSSIKPSSSRNAKIPAQLRKNIVRELVKLNDYEDSILATIKSGTAIDGANLEKIRQGILHPHQLVDVRKLLNVSPFGVSIGKAAKKREEINSNLYRLAEALTALYDRMQDKSALASSDGEALGALQKSVHVYFLALSGAAAHLECLPDATISLTRVIAMAQSAATVAEHLRAIPDERLAAYNEELYLAVNPDVAEEIKLGNLSSGLEHYIYFGSAEIEAGNRQLKPAKVLISDQHMNHAQGSFDYEEVLEIVRVANIVDEEWYCKKYDVNDDAVENYCRVGILQGRKPCYYFDTAWYLVNYADVRETGMPAVVHYVKFGESEGRNPSQVFDTKWYASIHGLRLGKDSVLAHYLTVGRSKRYSPNKIFDTEFYLKSNKDIAAVDVDPVEHCFSVGWREGRNPSAEFDIQFYIDSYFQGATANNPILHYLDSGIKSGLLTKENRCTGSDKKNSRHVQELNVSDETRYFANPGPDFEESEVANSNSRSAEAKARTIAFYLPQFYAFEENDEWWGKGFTEWRNVMRGSPRFEGHYQPRIPRDLGFYDLTNETTIVEQAELAMKNGIEGFCFYYYWFNGKRLMDKPLDIFANSKKIETPFCIMWANENWTRTWDGLDKEVLINQDYSLEDEDAFIADTLAYFKNERYITVQGRPLFTLYRPNLVPDGKETFARWKRKWKDALGVEPWIMMVQGFGDTDPSVYGLDGAVEFPPHKVCQDLKNINEDLNIIDKNFKGHVVSYDDVIKRSLAEPAPNFPLIKTVSPHWDNDARREGRGFVMQGSTPEKYENWLKGAVNYAEKNQFEGESFVFINAWNEWAEGAYLEPDVHFGHAYLNATRRAVFAEDNESRKKKILLVGHDAWPHGAQMLLLNMAKIFRFQFGMDVLVVLQKSGSLLNKYEECATVKILERDGVENVISLIQRGGYEQAITNTSVTGDVVPLLKEEGVKVLSLIHELPRLITEYGLEENVQNIAELSDYVVFPAEFVRNGFSTKAGSVQGQEIIQPQGMYKDIEYNDDSREKICTELGIPLDSKIILNVGFADLRKGFDLFLSVARQMQSEKEHVHFVWVGDMAPDMSNWIYSDSSSSGALSNFHSVSYTDHVSDYFSACDCFFLSSREDPYPSVVLEAMAVGKPVVIYENTTGLEDVVSRFGQIVDRNNMPAVIDALNTSINTISERQSSERISFVKEKFQFDEYCFFLLTLLRPDIKKVSVVVPNYNYDNHIESRLQSIFDQGYPVFETIVLDDCSKDNSIEVIEQCIEQSGRRVRFLPNEINSGNTFKQWEKGLTEARGDYLWIAEADDLADVRFLSASISSFGCDTVLSFTDSKQIDNDSVVMANSYDYYYRTISEELFSESFSLLGRELVGKALSVKNPILNVSSVVWRTTKLREALANTQKEVMSRKLVGDWRLYIEVMSNSHSAVSYINRPLNTHRRHASSVTHSLDVRQHLEEIMSIHSHVSSCFELDAETRSAMSAYIAELEHQFGLKNAA